MMGLSGTFQSTPSAWRVTRHRQKGGERLEISIHTLRVEGDRRGTVSNPNQTISIHTLRVEGDRDNTEATQKLRISIHTLRVEGDHLQRSLVNKFRISIHTLRVEGDLSCHRRHHRGHGISIHTLRVEGDCKSAQKSRTLLFKVTDLRRNCRPDVHERTEGSLWQAVFAG